MSRKRRRRGSRGPAVAVILMIGLVGAGLVFTRLYPGFRRSQARPRPPLTSTTPSLPAPEPPTRLHAIPVRLYYLRIVDGKERLVEVSRNLRTEAPATAALGELVEGEVPARCARPLPKGTTVRGVRVENGLATVDFSQELVSNFEGDSDNEGVVVYSIVNTLASLPTVKQVRILVEGRPIDSIGGHLDTSGSLSADEELVVSR